MTRRPRLHPALDGERAHEPIGRAIRTILQGAAAPAPAPAASSPSPWSPPMRTTMSFLTSTSSIASELPADPPAHQLSVVGYDRAAGRILLREQIGDDPAISVMSVVPTLGGAAGTTIPLGPGVRTDSRPLVKLVRGDVRGWELTTRVMQRRGLRVFGDLAPIRKFALGVSVQQRSCGVTIASGRAVATAYLRPRAALDSVWIVPGEPIAIAIVSYCGVPTGVGVDKQVAVLAVPSYQ